DLDVGRRALRDAAEAQGRHLRGIVVNDARHRRAAVDAAAGDYGDADRVIEAADAERLGPDAQIGAEGERKEAALELTGSELRVLSRGARIRARRRRLLVGGCEGEFTRKCCRGEKRSSEKATERSTVHHTPSYVRRKRTKPSCATEATRVPSRVNISPRPSPREPCRLGESIA